MASWQARRNLTIMKWIMDNAAMLRLMTLLKMAYSKAAGSEDTEAYSGRYVEVDSRPRTPL